MKALITLAAALALALPALTAQANELAGIKFGMSLTEAKSSLATNAKGLKMLSVSNNGIENGIYGYTEKGDPNKDYDQVLAIKGDADRIWFVERIQMLPANKRFTLEALIESLRKRYGKESSLTPQYTSMDWSFDNSGRLFSGGIFDNGAPCPEMGFVEGKGVTTPTMNIIKTPQIIGKTCKAYYKAFWSTGDDGLINYLDVMIIDYSLMNKYLQQREAKEKNEREQKVKQQSGVKPNL